MRRRLLPLAAFGCAALVAGGIKLLAQTPPAQLPDAPGASAVPASSLSAPVVGQPLVSAKTGRLVAMVNGRPYVRPTAREQFRYYVKDTYWWPGIARSMARALYGQGIDKPDQWGQDWPGFGQRLGTALTTTVINGNVRYGMEMAFNEDMRYIPCHGCSVKRKIGNALLSEFTARHADDGHRFFTLTPIVSDFSGPLIANSFWIPGHGPLDGLTATRTVAVTRIGGHLFTEFVLERRHKDPPYEDPHTKKSPGEQPKSPGLQPRAPVAEPAPESKTAPGEPKGSASGASSSLN